MSDVIEGVLEEGTINLHLPNGLPFLYEPGTDAVIVVGMELANGGLQVIEFDNFMEAMRVLAADFDVTTGNWSRIFIVNVEEARRVE